MTKLLEQAFAELARLPEAEQERLAAWILEELAAEQQWDSRFVASNDILAQLADEALSDQPEELDHDRL